MKLLPYHRFEISSPLKRQDALAAMAAHVEAPKMFRFNWPSSANEKRFEGEMTKDGFNVRRRMGYRNSFAPATQGEVHAAGAMSRIVVTMRPMTFVIVFFAIWYAALLAGLALGGAQIWMTLLLVVAPYLMVLGGFWFEANKQERALREIFRAL